MPHTTSHLKNIKIILRNRHRNRKYKLAIKKAIKQYLISTKNIEQGYDNNLLVSQQNLSLAYKAIDKAVKKKILHKNTASRKKSKLAQIIKAV